MSFYHDLIGLCDSVQALTGIRVCIYDYAHTLTADAQARDQAYFGHYCAFCRAIRTLHRGELSGREACIACDVTQLRTYATQTRDSFLHTCHIGLTELVIPIWREDDCLGVAFLGQCAVEKRDAESDILDAAERFGGDREGFRRLYREMSAVTLEQLMAAGNLVQMALAHLIAQYRALDIPDEPPSLARQCEAYLRVNFRLPINAESVARALHVNPSYLARVFRRDMGQSILGYLNEQRLNHAVSLLTTTDLPVAVIAENAGFADPSYFARFFRKSTGLTPSEYRKEKAARR